MKKLFVLFLMLGVASGAWASNDWLTNAASSDWFTGTNWSLGHAPSSTELTGVRTYQTHMNTTYMPIINYGDASAYTLEVGGDNDAVSPTKSIGTVTINGGTLTTADYFRCGASSTSNRWGAIYMNGGTVNVGGPFTVGWGSSTLDVRGWLYMAGGTINVTGKFTIGNAAGASGFAYVGGTINADDFVMKATAGTGTVRLDLSGYGRVIINGNKEALVQSYIDNGWIYTNGVQDTDYSFIGYFPEMDKTIIGIPEPATIGMMALGAIFLRSRKKF